MIFFFFKNGLFDLASFTCMAHGHYSQQHYRQTLPYKQRGTTPFPTYQCVLFLITCYLQLKKSFTYFRCKFYASFLKSVHIKVGFISKSGWCKGPCLLASIFLMPQKKIKKKKLAGKKKKIPVAIHRPISNHAE